MAPIHPPTHPSLAHPLQCAPSEDELKLLRSFLEAGGQQGAMVDAEKFAWELGQVGGALGGWAGKERMHGKLQPMQLQPAPLHFSLIDPHTTQLPPRCRSPA